MSLDGPQVSACLLEAAGLLAQGRSAAAGRRLRQVFTEPLDPELARGLELWRGNRPRLAARSLAAYNQSQPGDVRVLQLRAHTASQVGAIDEAITLLLQCLELRPGIMAVRPELARLLVRRQRYEEAQVQLDVVLGADPGNTEYLLLRAAVQDRSGQYAAAIATLREVIRLQSKTDTGPGQPDAPLPAGQMASLASSHTALAMIQRTVGDRGAAIQSLQEAIRLDPDSGWPWFQLADLKVYEFQPDEIARMRRGLAQARPGSMNEVHFAFALGRALESQQDVDEAFAAYARGNSARKALAPFDMAALHREFTAIKALFSLPGTQQPSSRQSGCPAIFIVGLPRSGTTLVDQIITAHTAVDGTMELPIVGTLVRELQQRQIRAGHTAYPAPGSGLDAAELAEMGQQYLQRAQVQRGTAPCFVDKMPFNFQHIGLIRLMLPGARIINVQRHPMALGFSIYQQLFRFGQDWAYDLEQIAQYYLLYRDLMEFWNEWASGEIIQVRYEQLVSTPEESIRRLLQQLQLPEEEACFRPHDNRRPVRTASSEQVRQPVHTAAVGYWQRFESHLQALRLALGEAAEA